MHDDFSAFSYRHHATSLALMALLFGACSSGGSRGRGDAGEAGTHEGGVVIDPDTCKRAVAEFCKLSCECSASGTCVTRNRVPIDSSYLAFTWSDEQDCAASYRSSWCGDDEKAPASIQACADAVAALACSCDDAEACPSGIGGAVQPRECESRSLTPEVTVCRSDEDCPDSHCVKGRRSTDGTIANLQPTEEGVCSRVCQSWEGGQAICGPQCSPGARMYCADGWSCVNSECRCVIEERDGGAPGEICDGRDNDCNGVIDDPSEADAFCTEKLGGESICDRGGCKRCTARCDGECVDSDKDPNHCGGCGQACDAGFVCIKGTCTD